LEISTLLAFNILAHISTTQTSLAWSFIMDVVQGMVERIMKWRKEDMYHVPKLVHEKLATIQKEESCWNAYIFCNFHVNCVPTYYKALLYFPHIKKSSLCINVFFSLNLTLNFICMLNFHFPLIVISTLNNVIIIVFTRFYQYWVLVCKITSQLIFECFNHVPIFNKFWIQLVIDWNIQWIIISNKLFRMIEMLGPIYLNIFTIATCNHLTHSSHILYCHYYDMRNFVWTSVPSSINMGINTSSIFFFLKVHLGARRLVINDKVLNEDMLMILIFKN
jgi:hypothetical protein